MSWPQQLSWPMTVYGDSEVRGSVKVKASCANSDWGSCEFVEGSALKYTQSHCPGAASLGDGLQSKLLAAYRHLVGG